MIGAAAHLIPYALVATLSPLSAAGTITVMRSGRLKALAFGVGAVLGQLAACGVLVAIGAAATPDRSRAHPTFAGLLEMAAGLALACFAVVERKPRPPSSGSGRSQAVLDRLGRVHVLTAGGFGLLLGIGGPKRLVLTCLAAASITAAGTAGSNEAALVVWYTLLATVVVWLPVAGYLLAGEWAVVRLDEGLAWLGRHRRPVVAYALAVVGGVLVVDGLLLLL